MSQRLNVFFAICFGFFNKNKMVNLPFFKIIKLQPFEEIENIINFSGQSIVFSLWLFQWNGHKKLNKNVPFLDS